jgi:choline-glycine betaine transporter
MNDLMLRFVHWWKTTKWAVYAVLGVCAAVLFTVLRNLTISKPSLDTIRIPATPPELQKKIAKVKEEADIARVQATVKADTQKAALDDLQKIKDDTERRQKLADMLKTL